MKIKVTIKRSEVSVIDIGQLPIGLIRDLLGKNDGTFDGNWSPYDVKAASHDDVLDSVTVEEVTNG